MLNHSPMKTDIRGRIRNTELADINYLMPVYESIVNSIHAIEEAGILNGQIDVFVRRDKSQLTTEEAELAREPVESFVIEDNGIGFNEVNYESFCTADSDHKMSKGGKGVGRLLWLKAFERAEIESHFLNGGGLKLRRFTFRISKEGIEDMTEVNSEASSPRTTVHLVGYLGRYRRNCPRNLNVIATRIIEHCLAYFVLETCPTILLHDDGDGTTINLGDYFQTTIKKSSVSTGFQIDGTDYSVLHLKLNATPNIVSKVTFCAHNRAVKDENLGSRILGGSQAISRARPEAIRLCGLRFQLFFG